MKQKFVDHASERFGIGAILSRSEINEFADEIGMSRPSWFKKEKYRVGSGKYKLPSDSGEATPQPTPMLSEQVQQNNNSTLNLIATNMEVQNLVPSKFEGFVPWGHFNTIKSVVKSGMFYPVFVTGLSGNGKTLMIEQIHANLKKDLIRVNITIETDEDDLLGGFRLVNGETKFVPGPVIEAMERGCTLLLDECDLGSNKLMCLQPVLEGKGVYLKKVNKWVTPKEGFNVMATANTKGKGSDDGRFIGTNILNEAFLERFAITIEQPYANPSTETKIILGAMEKYGLVDNEFAKNLVTWAEIIRKLFREGGVDEVISTRRLDHIVKAYTIFHDKKKAVELCISRFDEDTKYSFWELYSNIDAGINPLENSDEGEGGDQTSSDVQI